MNPPWTYVDFPYQLLFGPVIVTITPYCDGAISISTRSVLWWDVIKPVNPKKTRLKLRMAQRGLAVGTGRP